MLERDIQNAILQYLASKRVLSWRVNVGAVQATYKGQTRFVRFSRRGHSDIMGVLPDGRFLAIEVKRPGRTFGASPRDLYQKAFLHSVRAQGGLAGVARSIEDAQRILHGEEMLS